MESVDEFGGFEVLGSGDYPDEHLDSVEDAGGRRTMQLLVTR